MRDFVETAERIRDLIPEDHVYLRSRIFDAICQHSQRPPEAHPGSWEQLFVAVRGHFDRRSPCKDWERDICSIMRGEK